MGSVVARQQLAPRALGEDQDHWADGLQVVVPLPQVGSLAVDGLGGGEPTTSARGPVDEARRAALAVAALLTTSSA